jgi:DNA-binding NarL/FixJ family response regulator
MKILLLEDHSFFASELVEYFNEDTEFEVVYVKSYKEAVAALDIHKQFDYSILDVILQNGKTGIDIAKTYDTRLGKIMFLTGCTDQATLSALRNYIVVSKLEVIWPKLELFFADKLRAINESELYPTIK